MEAKKPQVFSIDDLEAHAISTLPKLARDYFNGGALDSVTLQANRKAFSKYYIRPRVLRDVANVAPQRSVFHHEIPFPCAVAPAAMQRMAHPDGELATARACGAFGTVMGLSTFSTTSLEDVKTAADTARREAGLSGDAELVLQMYLFENREASKDLIWRAERCGYKAIVLTVDTPQFGRRLAEIRNKFKLPPHFRMANFSDSLNVKTGSELRTKEMQTRGQKTQAPNGMQQNKNDPSLTWEAVSFLKGVSNLPIWLKGIMTAEDAKLAVEHGADAIFVSNHGGRQLDHAPPTLDVLPEIATAVNGAIPIHFDGGVRRGSDIFKALCLGADLVWIGRPAIWGIAYDGEHGLRNGLKLLEEEFQACMALAGCVSLRELKPDLLRSVTDYSRL